MAEEIINMDDMNTIFSVTDKLGIHRESVSVDLTREDPGVISQSSSLTIDITIPLTTSTQEFAERLESELRSLGYVETDNDDYDD
ncbi:MAG: hypothetical protein CL886_00930 [Dehalococcoidia bacterium]|nr:hypothetical protein [Dehalococcoidia bacterium]|tara:strand:+ start:1017 stop:1271 length:255 start_codon:yes stop_codon:yes gene_type:complete